MRVLLSIKPKYVEQILKGNKKFEFRKVIFKDQSVQEIFIYSSYPVKKIIGKFRVGDILEDHPDRLWMKVKDASGIDEEEFFNYFHGKEKGFAIGIDEMLQFDEPYDPWEHNSNFIAPQSFQYIDDSFIPQESEEFLAEC
ncbi:ASCH domain-containing protein [Methanocalculus sp.]|uniref:ASCH domain-containing protein n=1 Tax=Methanocalculus sp. TaxID=2004547 RepID=UPI002624ABDD|nr:ASCH domain-containing protein [Methanocalculus sp.]MDG6251362.1 hypothetical protein [Methanocalculus sp.]